MIQLKLLTADGKSQMTEVNRISIPTTDGIRTVLANHMEVVMTVDIGKAQLFGGQHDVAGKTYENGLLVVSQGIFHFKDNQARLFVRSYEFPEEIDLDRAERARDRAEKALQEKPSKQDQLELEISLKRALTRLSVKQ